ncbi:unnamed protein product, partial [marine sediment metagenome]
MPPVETSVTPITGSAVRWDDFLKDTLQATGHSLTRNI